MTELRLTRRQLLAAGAAVVAGGAGAALVGGRGVAEPLPGAALPELADLALTTAADGAREGALRAAAAGAGLAYNGTVPGPVLRLQEGDRVRLSFHNGTDAPTSLHLHGLPLTPAVDAPLTHLEPGEADLREFDVPAGTSGTYWYHPHAHGDVERQLLAGLAGAVVVTGPVDDLPGLAAAEDRLVMLTRRGSDILVNGVLRPVLTAAAPRVRLRLLNATAGDVLRLGMVDAGGSARELHLIATDTGLLERPEAHDEVVLPPGGRAEVLLDTGGAGRLRLRALPYSMNEDGSGAGAVRTLLTVDGPPGRSDVALPDRLGDVEEIDPGTAVRTRQIVLGADATGAFTVDGRVFDHGRTDLVATLGNTELWDVVNDGPVDHPFHLHSHRVQVLSRDGEPEPYRAWRDTVHLPAGHRVRLAVPLVGGPGRTVYHCHIAAHEDLGMMGVLDVRER